MERADDREVRVTVGVPTAEEAREIYGVDLADRGIQPVWIEVVNDREVPMWLLKPGIDPDYFSVAEVAVAFAGAAGASPELEAKFAELEFRNPTLPGATNAGFVVTHLDEGVKVLDIDLLAHDTVRSFTFEVVDPTFPLTVTRVDLDALHAPDELVHLEDETDLRAALERLPCCTTNSDGTALGDPLNLIVIGQRDDLLAAGLRRGWDPTELLHGGSLWRTVASFLSGERYRYAPISPLYAFGRPQDIAAQKARSTIHERNHARFWLTPLRFRGQEVWIGQISRDIGVKYTLKSPTISTHVIDPDVDEARNYYVEDMAFSQALQRWGFVSGVGAVTRAEPRFNLVGDPYYTDGLRAVLLVGPRPRSLSDIDRIGWQRPGHADEP